LNEIINHFFVLFEQTRINPIFFFKITNKIKQKFTCSEIAQKNISSKTPQKWYCLYYQNLWHIFDKRFVEKDFFVEGCWC